MNKENWYNDGLAFECQGCGDCCSGPNEGYVWVNSAEIAAMASATGVSCDEFKSNFCRRVSLKYSLKEKRPSNDCIFLTKRKEGGKYCEVYSSRPLQCRTWPFWKGNLTNKNSWLSAAENCPGINRGRLFNVEEIEAIRDGDLSPLMVAKPVHQQALDWIKANLENKALIEQVAEIYQDIAGYIESAMPACDSCGKCCNFGRYGHRLYASTMEMLVFFHFSRAITPFGSTEEDKCIYRDKSGCSMYEGRTAGCRIFYCRDFPDELQNEIYEQIMERLKQLHNHCGAVYYYADLTWWLKNNQIFAPKRKK